MELIPVTDAPGEKEFIKVNVELNAQIPNYIRPLDHEIKEVFNPDKNKAFRNGACIRWILKDDEGKKIGRVAAFVNKRYKNKGDDLPVGGIGFFDCINDQKAADMLFNVAKHWLMQQGMEAMDGPINFGERDKWWGLVTEGFQEPLYGMNYNPPYYKELFENYGFLPFYGQVCFGMYHRRPLSKKVYERHAALFKDPAFRATYLSKKDLEKYARDFTTVYNKAYAGHGGLKQLRFEEVMIMFKKMKPVMDEKIVWYAYHNEDPIALFINLPDLNQWFKYLNGKFDLLHKLKFLWIKRTRPNKKIFGLVFAIVPEFQGIGVDAFIVGESAKIIQPLPYKEYEMQWVGDFNPKMINVAEGLGEVFRSRLLTTYRYLFDRTRPFKRHPVVL